MLRRVAGILGLALAAGVWAVAEDPPGGTWRSAHYPEDWRPGPRAGGGAGLPDFSYAGYANGDRPIPDAPPGVTRDAVADHGADPTGARDATAAIQAAIDFVAGRGGGVVRLPAGTYRCDGRLEVAASRVVLRGEGAERTRLRFPQERDLTDRAALTFRGTLRHGPDRPLTEDGILESATVRVADASGLAVGDDVAVGWTITAEFVAEHGMTGVWKAFVGQWKPVFRRTVMAVDRASTPAMVTLDVPLRYTAKVRDGASLRVETGALAEVGVERLGVCTAVTPEGAWASVRHHAIRLEGVKDGWVREVASFASPDPAAGGAHLQCGGVIVVQSKRVTLAAVRMEAAQNRGPSGSGYLFEVSRSSEVLFRDCVGRAGRHNFIQNWDFGTSGCVFQRVHSSEGRVLASRGDAVGIPGLSEYHHSLAMACLVEDSVLDDGWSAANRGFMSSGAGHTATRCAFWNVRGTGMLLSWQYGTGWVIGTEGLKVTTGAAGPFSRGTGPEDATEGIGRGAGLVPRSLLEDQRARRREREGK